MARSPDLRTSVTLLGRLRCASPDQAAWGEFVERYGRKIYRWCRHWGLQEADAEDVTQDVLLKLADKMKTFAYDAAGSFRAWLKTLTHHAWYDFVQGRQHAEAGSGGSEVLHRLHRVEAREDLLQRLEAEFDRELLRRAEQRVQARVQARTWEAFRLLAVEGLPGAEAAERLGMTVAAAFVARSKVRRLIREEMRRLEKPGPPPGGGSP
jgi:RNA polymerase sigma-70 factor (ECF subfamily)